MPATANQPRTKFKTPEGRYNLVAESQSRHPFHFLRQTRLTIATLTSIGGTDEDGLYAVYSVGDGCLHLSRYNATHKEPLRSLALGNQGARSNALISCHDFLPGAKDGVDTLVGMSDGQVFMLSLRAQLQAPMNSKVALAAMLLPDASVEGARCCGVLWLPHTNGHFLAAYTTGTILIYKKSAVVNEGTSKFSLSISSHASKPPAPTSTITVSGGGINDVAVCPAPTGFIAAACRDGAVRIMSASSGQVIGGFHSYYGAMLCCCFSHDGRYLAAGGEDDLVSVYSMAERAPVAHCQGHQSWVSRVRFDPWLEVAPPSVTGLAGSHAGQNTASEDAQIYRVASVGQDARLCIWDVQMVPTEGEVMATPVAGTGMRKSASVQKLEMGRKASGDLLMMLQQQPVIPAAAPSHQRKPSASTSKPTATKGTVLPSMSYFDMNIVLPICEHRLHVEPISDVQFTESLLLTADHSGQIRTWARPPKDELMRRSLGPHLHG
mmetsp:Transcript_19632/g.54741  ORF Transcript_19632/g.54741 Transcript_19632/m.54741 type:complete len:493 (+) Transcript_19632:188-1666(+)